MTRSLQEEKVFKDPVHKYIYVQDQTIWDLINTKEFQRRAGSGSLAPAL